ncbi:hypothetical protein [Nocardioides sp.]|uniref:hypothetical protein n=1 Tax=Nocardioides sp. TaxID=35761 RepID=UPI002BDE4B56|nr:hypothetical protein [Nocardioides sp.]HSX68454.1 hypothetical protein [Nocardioides sp.]
MTETINDNLIDAHRSITEDINALKGQRVEVIRSLISAGIEADEEVKGDLELELSKAQATVKALSDTLAAAEATKAALDRRIDGGDDSVSPLEVVEADMAIRATKGKLKPAEADLRKAQRAVDPLLADNHLALFVADTISELVDVPVLVRKRPGDVKGIADAVILSQTEPTKGYGTVKASGIVRVTERGVTGLDLEALEDALRGTGSEVNVYGDVIDFDSALWPVTRLAQPSVLAVSQFAEALEQTFGAEIQRGKKAGNSYAYYKPLWQTIEASLDVIEAGTAKGKVVAVFGIQDEYPPLYQMQGFINDAISHFRAGVHTSAGVLSKINVAEVKDCGPWVPEGQPRIYNRMYDGKFGITVELDFTYEPVEVSA